MAWLRRKHSFLLVFPSALHAASSQRACPSRENDFQCAELNVFARKRTPTAQQPVLRVPEANEAAAEL